MSLIKLYYLFVFPKIREKSCPFNYLYSYRRLTDLNGRIYTDIYADISFSMLPPPHKKSKPKSVLLKIHLF